MENIYNFLNDLKRNNNREWFNENKDRYELAREEANAIFSSIAEELNRIDDFSPYKLYRIYRDVRFSKDKRLTKDTLLLCFQEDSRTIGEVFTYN